MSAPRSHIKFCNYKPHIRFFSPLEFTSVAAANKKLILEKIDFLEKSVTALEAGKKKYWTLQLGSPVTAGAFSKLKSPFDEWAINFKKCKLAYKELNLSYERKKRFFDKKFQKQFATLKDAIQDWIKVLDSFYRDQAVLIYGPNNIPSLFAADQSNDFNDLPKRKRLKA